MSKSNQMIEDYLDEDPEIPGQKYALLSFISPENVLQQKEHYFFEKFLQSYEVNWKVKNLEKFLADMVTRINDDLSNITPGDDVVTKYGDYGIFKKVSPNGKYLVIFDDYGDRKYYSENNFKKFFQVAKK